MTVQIGRCIYHLGTDGGFEKEAHLIPERASNEDCLLPPGRECDVCNGKFGKLEQYIIRAFPGQFFRVAYVEETSRGRTPTANIRGGKITRAEPSPDSEADPTVRILGYRANPETVETVLEPDRSITTFKLKPLSGRRVSAFLARIALGYLCLEGRDVYASEYDHLRACALTSDPEDPSFFIPCFIGIHAAPTQEIRWFRNGESRLDALWAIQVTFPGFAGIIATARDLSPDDLEYLEAAVKQHPPGFLFVRHPGLTKPFTFVMTLFPATDENRRQLRELWAKRQSADDGSKS